jgi:predicted hotdog family 3-hydroxylacyl-ACP dehydratase
MTATHYPPIEDVLPHAGRMVLLTRVADHTDRRTVCVAEISSTSIFADADGGVPAWVALEYMAQCIAAHGGLRARATGDPVPIGFLLGSRSIALHTSRFEPGQRLEVEAAHVWGEHDFFSFACAVRDGATGVTLAEGTLAVARAGGADTLVQPAERLAGQGRGQAG